MNPATSSPATLVLVDNQSAIRNLLQIHFERPRSGYQVVAEAATANAAFEFVEKWKPALVVADIFLHEISAMEFVQTLARLSPTSRLVAFCQRFPESMAADLLGAGITAAASKEEPLEILEAALIAAKHGGCYLSPAFTPECPIEARRCARLTERESRVLRLIAEGVPTKQLGDHLDISVKTAEKYREKIMAKLKVHDVVNLTRYAIRHGFAAL